MQTESVIQSPAASIITDIFDRNPETSTQLAINDIKSGLQQWRIWLMLAYQDIRLRYRRSVLGPFWLTLSMAITVYTMGFLYGHLFHIDITLYFPYLVAGMLSWSLISLSLNDLTDAFIIYERLIKEIKLPYTLHIQRITMRNFFIFLHNIIVIVPVYIFFSEGAAVNFNTLYLIPALFLVYLNCIFLGLILAMIAARYRDVSQIIKNIIQIIFFVTPVMWDPNVLPLNKLFVVWCNPVYPFIEIIREPLLGHAPTLTVMIISLGITLLNTAISFTMFKRYRSRIIYWL